MTLAAVYGCLSTVSYLLIQTHDTGFASLWFPPAGLAFGYLVIAGAQGAPVVLLAQVLGGLLTESSRYSRSPLWTLLADALAVSWYALCAVALRRSWRPWRAEYGSLTRFLLIAVVAAPLGAATIEWAEAISQDLGFDAGTWARVVVGQATSVSTLAPAFIVVTAAATSGRPMITHVPRSKRLEIIAQSLVIALMPALFVFTHQVKATELALMPLALVPLGVLAVYRDQTRGSLALALTSLALGAAAQARFGDSETTFRLQAIMFTGALAALYAGAGLCAEAGSRHTAAVESTRWRALIEATPAVVARVGSDGRWRIEGADGGQAARPDRDTAELLARAAGIDDLAAAVAAATPRTVQWGDDDADGRRFVTHVAPLPDGETLTITTETTRLHGAEIALAWERSHDRETDLPNRDLLIATASQVAGEGTTASLVVIDVDRATRRAELVEVDPIRLILVLADRIRRLLDEEALARGQALVARIGDDQFGILLPEGITAARERTEGIVRALRESVPTGNAPLVFGAWAGVAALEATRGAPESLRRAGAALQAATEGGRQVVILDGLSVATTAERARLSGEVVAAVDRRELDIVYQPDVDLADGRLTGVEALVRWRRRQGFAAATDLFVRIAEEAGAVQGIDAWVMEESLRAMGEWRGEHHADLELGLNVSALSLTEDLPERLFETCVRHGVPPECIRLEVTETALADDSQAPSVLRRVRQRGCRVALDDFGTGYATLSRLRRLPVDVLKLDRSFLPPITEDLASQALVSLVLGLAGPLRVEVVVEGVETQAQRDVLVGLGCRRAQGFLFSRPVPEAVIRRMLTDGPPLPGATPVPVPRVTG